MKPKDANLYSHLHSSNHGNEVDWLTAISGWICKEFSYMSTRCPRGGR